MPDTYIKLHGYTTEQFAGGVSVCALSVTYALGNGTTVELPVPFVPIGNGLAITPAVNVDGDTALRVDMAKWAPARIDRRTVAWFPLNFNSQATAVTVARAYDADPRTSWTATVADVLAWMRQWGPVNGINFQSLDQQARADAHGAASTKDGAR